MRIFVAGATGAIGRPLVSALIMAGHSVVGLTRTPRQRRKPSGGWGPNPSSPTVSTRWPFARPSFPQGPMPSFMR